LMRDSTNVDISDFWDYLKASKGFVRNKVIKLKIEELIPSKIKELPPQQPDRKSRFEPVMHSTLP